VPAGWDVGMGLAIQSYDRKLFFGFTFDAQAAPDGERMKEFLDASFVELCQVAKVPGSEPAAKPKRAPRRSKPEAQPAAPALTGAA